MSFRGRRAGVTRHTLDHIGPAFPRGRPSLNGLESLAHILDGAAPFQEPRELQIAVTVRHDGDERLKDVEKLSGNVVERLAHLQQEEGGRGETATYHLGAQLFNEDLLRLVGRRRTRRVDGERVLEPSH
jgi:hypothetical protein